MQFATDLIRKLLSFTIVRFGITGGLAFILEFMAFYALLYWASPEQSDFWKNVWNIVSIEISILFTFHMHNFFTWSHEHQKSYLSRIVNFHVVTGLTILLRIAGFYFINDSSLELPSFAGIESHDIKTALAKMIPLALAIIINYITYNFFIFKATAPSLQE